MIYFEGLNCESCGASIDINRAENGVVRCPYCDRAYMLAKSENPAVLSFLRQGEHDLDTCKFDDAYTAYSKAAELDSEEPEAYFGLALAKFKVQYLKDETSEPPRMQAICHEVSSEFFSDDKNYRKALEFATSEQRKVYRKRAQEIDDIREEFNELKRSGLGYDCFLCVKVTNEDGGRTADYDRANDIYYHLKDLGYSPFFSEREMKNRTGADYEALILYALYTSECMLIVCSNEEYLRTKWVKNEYTRFLKMIADEEKEKDAITFAFHGTPIEKLPNRSGKIQGIDLSKPDAYSRIEQFVTSHTPEARKRREEQEQAKKRAEAERDNELKELRKQLQKMQEERATATAPATGNLAGSALRDMLRQMQAEDEEKKREEERKKHEEHEKRLAEERAKAEVELKKREEERKEREYRAQFEIENNVLKKYRGNGGDVVVPDGVTAIGVSAFAGCSSLTSVTLPEGVTFIKERAFFECNGLTNITIPNSVNLIGRRAFDGCKKLTNIKIPNGVTSIGDYAFAYCSALKSSSIPNSITTIGDYVFAFCNSLENVTIPDSVISIGVSAFSGCSVLGSIKIPSSVTSIAGGAFRECVGLSSVVIPDGVTTIGINAFFGCKGLKNIIIPRSVHSIGEEAFASCGLPSVTIPKRLAGVLNKNLKKIFGDNYKYIPFTFTVTE